MSTTGVSLPLLVRDWVKKRCPSGVCFFIREYHDIKFDPLNNVEEEVLGTIVVTSNGYSNRSSFIMDVTLSKCSIDKWAKAAYSNSDTYEGTTVRTIEFDWRAPNFFRKIGRIVKCRCKKL